mmetsp:Transcript_6797/g.21253  ORF Transcript_6797/g.21253 Transcript_6797/m.21253 type:complete len:148 (+) Transcript_6797:270-713(+)
MMLKTKLVEISKQVGTFQEQGLQLKRVIDQCKSQKEDIEELQGLLETETRKVTEEVVKNKALALDIDALKRRHDDTIRIHAEEVAQLRNTITEAMSQIDRMRQAELELRGQLERMHGVPPPSDALVLENERLRKRIETLEAVYCPYG